MLLTATLLLALVTGSGPSGADWNGGDVDGLRAARAELEEIAGRIELLKSRRRAGAFVDRELDRLLVRGQELAVRLERAEAAHALQQPAQPEPEELRERADVLHDQADRLAAAVATLDVKIQDARRSTDPGPGLAARAAVATRASAAPAPELLRLQALVAERAQLAGELGRLRAAAASLEAEAARLEAER